MLAAKFCSENIDRRSLKTEAMPVGKPLLPLGSKTTMGFFPRTQKCVASKRVAGSTSQNFRPINKMRDLNFIKDFASKQNLVCKIISTTLQKISNDNDAYLLKEKVNWLRNKHPSQCSSKSVKEDIQANLLSSIPRKSIIFNQTSKFSERKQLDDATDPATPRIMTTRFSSVRKNAFKPILHLHTFNPSALPSHNKFEHVTFESINMLSEIREKTEGHRRRFKFKY